MGGNDSENRDKRQCTDDVDPVTASGFMIVLHVIETKAQSIHQHLSTQSKKQDNIQSGMYVSAVHTAPVCTVIIHGIRYTISISKYPNIQIYLNIAHCERLENEIFRKQMIYSVEFAHTEIVYAILLMVRL